MREALIHRSYAKSVHGIGKSMHVSARFADMGDMWVVLRKQNGSRIVMKEDEFLDEYPIRLKAPWEE